MKQVGVDECAGLTHIWLAHLSAPKVYIMAKVFLYKFIYLNSSYLWRIYHLSTRI